MFKLIGKKRKMLYPSFLNGQWVKTNINLVSIVVLHWMCSVPYSPCSQRATPLLSAFSLPASLLLVKPVWLCGPPKAVYLKHRKEQLLQKGGGVVKKGESCLNRTTWAGLIQVSVKKKKNKANMNGANMMQCLKMIMGKPAQGSATDIGHVFLHLAVH